jgi:hypothetical protein
MKVFAKFLFVSVVISMVAGCASDVVYIPKVPQAAQAKLLDYKAQPGNKVFILAVDPGGDFAFGYDYGKATLKEAVEVATKKCDVNREAHRISAKPYIYALNDVVVYEDMIRRDNQMTEVDEMEVQPADAATQDAEDIVPPAAE